MENLTYKLYRDNPNFRHELEAEAARLRHEAVRMFVVDPVVRFCKRVASLRFTSVTPRMTKSA